MLGSGVTRRDRRDLGLDSLVNEAFNDLDKVKKVLGRAFPGAQPGEDEVRARRDKLQRADPRGGAHSPAAAAPSDGEREAAERQAAARGAHTIYDITTRHNRTKPMAADWVGHCQAVRVTLAQTSAEATPIWTHLGVVKAEDHLAFSVQDICAGYAAQFGSPPKLARVDLVTGARHYDLDRFSPISTFLGFENETDEVPSFYVYESGSAQGNPAKLYWARTLDSEIVDTAGFQFTPFACSDNWYRGRLIMNRAKTEPSIISISISLDKGGERHYLTLTASYAVVDPGPVVWPITVQIEAALRVFAIAQGMGCELDLFEQGLGQLGRTFDWITTPPQRGTPQGYSGCSKST